MSHSSNTQRGTPAPSEVGGTRSTSTTRDDSKVAKPDLYYGDRQGLDDWLNQMDLYYIFTPMEEAKKTIFAIPRQTFAKFKTEIRRIFGISNEDKVAVRHIQHIRQHTSASEYAAKFQEHAQVTDWDDSALMTMYRRGLKENVKDELMRAGMKIEDLDDLIRATIEIDDNLYERAMERRHDIAPEASLATSHTATAKEGTTSATAISTRILTDPSQWNSMLPKKGHMARDCHSKNKVPRRQFNMMQRRSYVEPERVEPEEPKPKIEDLKYDYHGRLSWTACYDDSCLIHYSSKMESGWFPSRPKGRGKGYCNVIIKKDDLEEGEIEEDDVESDPEEDDSDEEEESEEESDNDDHDHLCSGKEGIEILHAYVPSCFTKMFNVMMKYGEEAFPETNGQRFLHPHNFDNMLDQIRNAFWEHRLVVVNYDFKAFIQEKPPLGSTFAPAGYIIPTGERVNKSMRDGINLLRSRYAQAQQQQRVLYERHLHEQGLDNGKAESDPTHQSTAIRERVGSLGKGSQRECNTIQALASTSSTTVFRTPVTVQGRRLYAMIDSGASGNFISTSTVNRFGLATQSKEHGYELVAVDGSALPGVSEETVPLQLVTQRHHEDIIFDVVEMTNHHIVLGMPWLRQHNPTIDWKSRMLRFQECDCVVDSRPAHRQRSVADERKGQTKARTACVAATSTKASSKQHDSGSAGTDFGGQTGHEARVIEGSHVPSDIPEQYSKWKRLFQEEENANAEATHIWTHLCVIRKELKTLREYLDENLARGFIRKSESPAGYPILFAPKKDGSLRLCVDYRKINDITIKNRYPLPNIEELQDRLSKAKWFSKIDLKGAYNLIRMKEGEEWKTAFRTRYGHYEYLVMPFGLTNAPATCQMMINDTLREYLDRTVVAYLDDILIYTNGNLEQHVKDVQQVLTKLQERRLKANPKKCEFHVKETEFLGFIIGVDGIRIDPAKITSIKEWPTPKNLKEVQSFLGLANYNRKFISGYSQTALPLVELTKQDTPFIWKERQQKAFEALKQACIDGPTLRMFDSGKLVHIETDASDRAIGACLTQDHEGKRHPVAYYSRKMTPAEQNYDIHDKELLAIVAALQHWRVYAEGAPSLTILTDHKNLLTFTTTKVLNRRQVRWSELLGQYKFKIQYTPGKDNGRADALSRRIDYMEGKEAIVHSILQTNKDGTLSARTHEFNAVLRIMKDDEEEFPISHNKYQVPEKHQEQCIRDHHDDPIHGHPGITKTIEIIRRNFAFPQMKEKVTTYVQKCRSCQMNKSSRHAKYGEIQFVDPPLQPWDEVTMDFITGLRSLNSAGRSKLCQQYDSILVMVDRLTKYTHFIPCMKSITAEELAHLVLDRLIRYHGIPKSFITDRDKLFTSNYWKTLVSVMGIKHKLSTAYHPQTDGQTERANQTLEAYLRHYVSYAQDNWVLYLPMAQLALNNQISATTGVSPFYANFGKHPNLFMEPRLQHPNADKAMITSDALKKLHKQLRQKILSSQNGLRNSRQKSKPDPQLKEGDKVYLLTKNLRSQRTTRKLDHVKVGPFLISEVRGPVNYKLQLPDDAKIHPVFHISLLEPADPETPLQTTFHFQTEENDEFEVSDTL
ncbi:unnamed protein product [Aureobasidium pullulans]|nr:unnamed protein product [Aureobasidium pullulans]